MAKASAIFLREPIQSGFAVMAKAAVLHQLLMALGDDFGQVASNEFYDQQLLPMRGRESLGSHLFAQAFALDTASGPRARTATFGIHAPGQKPLASGTATTVSSNLGHQVRLHLQHPAEAERLRLGQIGVTGISGTSSMLLYMLDTLRHERGLNMPARDLLLGAATYMVYDGGHSFSEVMWTFDHGLDGAYASLQPKTAPQSYRQLQQLFFDTPEVQSAFTDALQAMRDHQGALAAAAKAPPAASA